VGTHGGWFGRDGEEMRACCVTSLRELLSGSSQINTKKPESLCGGIVEALFSAKLDSKGLAMSLSPPSGEPTVSPLSQILWAPLTTASSGSEQQGSFEHPRSRKTQGFTWHSRILCGVVAGSKGTPTAADTPTWADWCGQRNRKKLENLNEDLDGLTL
jgi:hypothetical protein